MKGYECERLEKKILKYIFGDGTDQNSGLSLVELRNCKHAENASLASEYDSRKAKFGLAIWEYSDYFGGNNDNASDKYIDEIPKLIDSLWLSFVPDLSKEKEYALRYIRKSLKRIMLKTIFEDGYDKNNKLKILKYQKLFNSVRPDLDFDIQNHEHQNLLAEFLLEEYLARHDCVNETKKRNYYLRQIKEAARLDRISVESIDYENSDSSSTKIDVQSVVENNTIGKCREDETYKVLFSKIQERFSHSQDREGKSTRKYLSALITIRLVREKNKSNSIDVLFFDLMKEYDFSDKELLRELRQDFDKGTKFPKQKEIAARFVRPATGNERKGDDASRYLKPYVKIMKEYLS